MSGRQFRIGTIIFVSLILVSILPVFGFAGAHQVRVLVVEKSGGAIPGAKVYSIDKDGGYP